MSHGESVAVLRGYDYHEASALTGLHVEDVLGAMDRRLKMVRALRCVPRHQRGIMMAALPRSRGGTQPARTH